MNPPDALLVDRVRTILAADPSGALDESALRAAVHQCGVVLDNHTLALLLDALRGELRGLGPLDPLLRDPALTDIVVNGPDEVWVDRGHGLIRVGVRFAGEEDVRRLAVRLAGLAGRRLDDAVPWVDARLPGGQRLHAVIPPLAVRGTAISLRVPSRRLFTLADLQAVGSIDATSGLWLSRLVAARVSFLVTGGTGSGKTSILNALLGQVSPNERIVIVEDTCELAPAHPHVVSLEARPANLEGAGAVSLRTLVRQALRMRPDRLVVGEVRGAEIVDMLAGFNTGHEGGCGTLHANSARAVPDRIAALGQAAGMTLAGINAQLVAGLEAVVHLGRTSEGRRVVAEIAVLAMHGGVPVVEAALVHDRGRLVLGPGAARLAERLGIGLVEPSGPEPPVSGGSGGASGAPDQPRLAVGATRA